MWTDRDLRTPTKYVEMGEHHWHPMTSPCTGEVREHTPLFSRSQSGLRKIGKRSLSAPLLCTVVHISHSEISAEHHGVQAVSLAGLECPLLPLWSSVCTSPICLRFHAGCSRNGRSPVSPISTLNPAPGSHHMSTESATRVALRTDELFLHLRHDN
jgi:hypothetical protein